MNIELLQKIKTAILTKPTAFDMGNWFQYQVYSPCGTSACLAGWAITLGAAHSDKPSEGERVFEDQYSGRNGKSYSEWASELLDLPPDFNTRSLFYASCWPEKLADRQEEAVNAFERNPETLARIAADRIDHLIATGE